MTERERDRESERGYLKTLDGRDAKGTSKFGPITNVMMKLNARREMQSSHAAR